MAETSISIAPATLRRQRRLETIEADIRSALNEVQYLKEAGGRDATESIAWAEARLDYARSGLKSLKSITTEQ